MTSRREDAATATVGYGGVATGAALRHRGLERAYAGQPRPKFPLFHEVKLVRRGSKGRAPYLVGVVTGTLATPAAAVGTAGVLTPREKAAKRDYGHRDIYGQPTAFIEEGLTGAGNAITERGKTVTRKVPLELVAGNYLVGAGIGAGTGAVVHRVARKVPGGKRAALAATLGTAAGSASLPLQSRATRHVSHDKYEVTSTGVRRAKKKRVPASAKASIHEGRARMGGDPRRFRAETVPGGVGKRRRDDEDPLVYPGSDLSRGAKRTIVGSVPGPPLIGDLAQAFTAGRMAPRPLRAETGARTFAGNQAGSLTGQVAGAYGAAYLAHRSPGFNRKATQASELIDQGAARARAFMGMKPKPARGFVERHASRLPEGVKRVVRPLAKPLLRNKKVSLLGAAAGGLIGGQIGTQTGYGSALNKERTWRNSTAQLERYKKINKRDENTAMSARERKKLANRKQASAVLSMASGTTGLTALGITGLSRHPKFAHLEGHRVPLLTVGAGLAGVNAFTGAGVQRKEAQQQLAPRQRNKVVIIRDEDASKALRVPRVPGVRRAPSIRAGFVRQTRYPGGMTRVSTVRGGLA